MAKITYTSLQKKFAGQIVAINKSETKVLAFGKDVILIKKELTKKGFVSGEYVFFGPIPEFGTVSILPASS